MSEQIQIDKSGSIFFTEGLVRFQSADGIKGCPPGDVPWTWDSRREWWITEARHYPCLKQELQGLNGEVYKCRIRTPNMLIDNNLGKSTLLSLNAQLLIFLTAISGWMNRTQQHVIDYLLEENRILKEQLGNKKLRLTVCQRRRLAEKGKLLGDKLKDFATIVTPATIYHWHRKFIAMKYTPKRPKSSPERERHELIASLAVKFATENPSWGYGRIMGALAELDYKVCRATVANMLKRAGIAPSPNRENQSDWKTFIKTHLNVLAAADFFSTEVWTPLGLVRYNVLFVIDLATRHVHIAHISCQWNGQLMAQIARNLTDWNGFLNGKQLLICDKDPLYTAQFRMILKSAGVKIVGLPPASPYLNGYAERFVRSIKYECLNKLIIFGEGSLRHAITNYMAHYHHERTHQGLDNVIPFPYAEKRQQKGEIECFERLGGLLKYYHRQAA